MTGARHTQAPGFSVPAASTTPTGHRRIGALTGIRWWAAFGVLLSHNIPGGSTPRIVQSFFEQGNLGVTVFFVLSGFILTFTYGDALSHPTPRKVWGFYVARIARVYPLYLLVLIWVTLERSVRWNTPVDGNWFAHLFGAQAWLRLPHAWEWNGPAWSVSVEFFFYALFPLLIFLARPLLGTPRKALALAGIGLLAVVVVSAVAEPIGWTSDGTATVLPPIRLCDFFLGMGIGALYLRAHSLSLPRLHRYGLILLGVWLVWTLGVVVLRTFYYGIPGLNIAYAIPSAALILGLAWTPDFLLTRSLSTKPMIVLGEASYAFYLVHMSAGAYLTVGLLSNGLGIRTTLLWVFGVIFVTAMAIGLNIMIETPARKLVRQWLMPRRKRVDPPPADRRPGESEPAGTAPQAAHAAPAEAAGALAKTRAD